MPSARDRGHLLAELTKSRVCKNISLLHTGILVRTNIMIDDQLMANALKVTGFRTKKEAVEEGLKLLILRNKQREIRKLRGKLKWKGSLDEMRRA